jgi:glycosyltransferase involved in cell wall biosynthesis
MSRHPQDQPKVSIVIPTSAERSRRSMLDRAIGTAYEQACAVEIIVVVNGNRVDRQALADIEADERVARVMRLDEGNVSAARYAGLEAATGDYFGFLDDDDELLPNAMSTRLALFRPDRDVVSTNGYVVEAGKPDAIFVPLELDPNAGLDTSVLEFNWFLSFSSLFRTASVPRSLFDVRLRYFEWSYLFFKLLDAGVRIHFTHEPTYRKHEDHPVSVSRSIDYELSYTDLLLRLRAFRMSPAARRMLRDKYVRGLAGLRELELRRGHRGAAWAAHLRCIANGGWRHLPATRSLFRRRGQTA